MKVSILFIGSQRQLNGAASVVRIFDEHKEVFVREGIEFESMLTYDCVDPKSYSETKQSHINDDRRQVATFKSGIITKLKSTYLGSCACIEKFHVQRAKKLIEYYFTTPMTEEVLLFHDTFTCYEYLMFARKKKICKKVILVHHNTGDEWKSLRMYYPKIVGSSYYKKLENMAASCYDCADAIVFVSDASMNNFIELRGNGYRRKLFVIKNGINDIGKPAERSYDSLRLVTVGTVNERKNQLNLIRCLSGIDDKTIHLVVVGEGGTYEACREYVSKHHLESQVEMLGKRLDVADILAQNNVFILPSLGEGLPIAGIEALRSGLPLILTDVGGNRELVDGNGIIIGSDNGSIKSGIEDLDGRKSELRIMGRRSREIYEEYFSAEIMIKNYCELIKEICRWTDED